MSLRKPKHPLNTAVISLGVLFFFYACMMAVTAILWHKSIDCSAVCTAIFFAGAVVLSGYALYSLRLNSRQAVRDRINYWSLLTFIPAAVIIAVLELFSGYIINTANVNRDRLNDFFYKELDEEKLCAKFMVGEDPQSKLYQSENIQEMLKSGKVPKFRGIYSGDFATSFTDGGKVYLKIGRYAIEKMREAAAKRDSGSFVKYTGLCCQTICHAAEGIRDPEHAAEILAKELVPLLQESVTANFPDDKNFRRFTAYLYELREGFENGMMSSLIYDTYSVLNRYDFLLSNNAGISQVLNADMTPVWSDADIIAGKLFPTARRIRIADDYTEGINYLQIYRGTASSVYSAANQRIEALGKALDKLKKQRCHISAAFVPDIRAHLLSAAKIQHSIENAWLACEIELFRREYKRLPDKLEEVQHGRIMSFPSGHLDGTAYTLVKGKFKDRNGKEYSGYALTVPTGNFVITDRK